MKKNGIKFKRNPRERIGFTKLTMGLIMIFKTLNRISLKLEKIITVTSMNDGRHRVGSYHYEDNAVDIRIWGFSESERIYIVTLINNNAIEFTDENEEKRILWALLEKDHIHIEARRVS